MLLRFVPYIGAVIAAVFPAALAIAVAPGWSMLVWTLVLFAVVEPITGSVVEPWLYGRNTGISAVAIIVAAAFWTWLWGPIGLLLSTPLTVCLVVVGRHVDRLKFLDILLGDRPALAPEEGFYQRVLAGDPDEAAVQAEAFLKGRPLSAYYDEVAIKGLALAQLDMNRGGLDHDRRVQIKEAVDGIIDDLSDHDDTMPAVETTGDSAAEPPRPASAEDPVAPAWRENAGAVRRRSRLARRGDGGDAGAAARQARHRRARYALRRCVGRQSLPARHGRCRAGLSLLPGGRRLLQCALSRPAPAPQAAARDDRHRILDIGRGRREARRRRCRRPARISSSPRSARPSTRCAAWPEKPLTAHRPQPASKPRSR